MMKRPSTYPKLTKGLETEVEEGQISGVPKIGQRESDLFGGYLLIDPNRILPQKPFG